MEGIKKETSTSSLPFSGPNRNVRGMDMPPHIVETAREAMAVRPRGRMSAGPETDTKLPAIRVPINPARSPNRVPAAEK